MAPAFAYDAVNATGRRVRGHTSAAGPDAAERALTADGLLVLSVTETSNRDSQARSTLGPRSHEQVLEVTRALAALLTVGLPLARALSAAGNLASGDVAKALEIVRHRVERGEALAAALSASPEFFPPLYVGLVRAGERSGDLAGAFARLATQLERAAQLRARLVSAAIYPSLLATLGGSAVLVLLFFVIPRFATLLENSGTVLPRSTAFMMGVSGIVRHLWPLVLGVPAALGFALVAHIRTDGGRRQLTSSLLRLPVVSSVQRNRLAGQFARLAGTLVRGGLPLLAALDQTAECLADPVAKDETVRIRARVREGATLHGSIAERAIYPTLLSQLVAVGEQSGRLGEFLLKAAEIFEERTDRAVQRLVTLLEPAIIMIFGAMVALVGMALLQAVYGINAGSFR